MLFDLLPITEKDSTNTHHAWHINYNLKLFSGSSCSLRNLRPMYFIYIFTDIFLLSMCNCKCNVQLRSITAAIPLYQVSGIHQYNNSYS